MEAIDWTAADITKVHHQLFVLQWIEVFDESSLDTWQVRSSNLLSILGELEDVARVASFDHAPAQGALGPLLDEAIGCIERDLVAKHDCPYLREELQEMKTGVGFAAGSVADIPRLEAVGRRARVLRERVSRIYRKKLLKRLRAMLAGTGREKEDQLYLTMSLATELASQGYSLQHLRQLVAVLLEPKLEFIARFDLMIRLCDEVERKFRVFFVVREWEPGVKPTRQGSWIRRRDEAREGLPDVHRVNEFFGAATASDNIVCVEARGLDPFAARASAEAALTSDFAAIAFASFRDPKFTLRGNALVIDEDNTVLLTEADGTRREALTRSRDWLMRTDALLRMGEVLEAEDLHHLSATLQYYRLAVTHPSDEVRLVNLWVAAETLARRAGVGSVLSRVTSALAPLLAVRNVRRVTRGFARRLGTIRFKKLRQAGLMDRHERHVDALRLLRVLKDEQLGQVAMAQLDEDPLLRFRLGRFADKALKSGATAADYLEANRRNIEWQLGRIYRARNAIVHRGERPRATRQLLQHLETYVWTAIRQVTSELVAAEGRWSLSDALDHWRTLYDQAVRVSRSLEKAPLAQLIEPASFLELAREVVPPAERSSPTKAAPLKAAGHE